MKSLFSILVVRWNLNAAQNSRTRRTIHISTLEVKTLDWIASSGAYSCLAQGCSEAARAETKTKQGPTGKGHPNGIHNDNDTQWQRWAQVVENEVALLLLLERGQLKLLRCQWVLTV